MRYVIYGAGAVGGTIGGKLFKSGRDVLLIARGNHLHTIRERGLRLRTPDGGDVLPIPAVGSPREIDFAENDVVILTMKTQDSEAALRDLESAAPADVLVVCAQNGIENERMATRRFTNVYAMLVYMPATHLEPGEVVNPARVPGVLHAGRFPSGTDSLIERVCADLRGAGFVSEADPTIMRLKYRKLLANLGAALQIVTEQPPGNSASAAQAASLRDEALRCWAAAGIEVTSAEEFADRVEQHFRPVSIAGETFSSSSTWQSFLRGKPESEVDYLNGEVVLLGALLGVPTPWNAVVRRLAATRMRERPQPPPISPERLGELVDAAVVGDTGSLAGRELGTPDG